MTKLAKFDFKPGLHRESTQYEEQGNWYDGDRVRFRAGKPENMRGYETKVSATFEGNARDLITYKSGNNNIKRAVFGTPDRLYEHDGDRIVDITPITTAVELTNCFGTSSGSTRVCCSDAAHGRVVGDYVYFTSSAAFNNVSLQGNTYEVVSVDSAAVFTISVTDAANATASDTGSATFNYLIPTGNSIAVGGTGYGAAPYQATVCASDTRAWNQAASADATDIVFDITQWSLDNWGDDVVANRNGSNIYYFNSDASTVPVRATSITTSPISVNSIVVSPNDRHLIALGANEYSATATVSGTFNPMLVRWSDQDDRTNWVPSVSSTSGEVVLTDGTRIVGGVRSRTAINIWTDNSLWLMQFAGPPFTFKFTQMGSGCGLISPHAAVDYDGRTAWMGFDNFYAFDGQVRTLDCTVRRYIFDRLNESQKDKIFAGVNSEFKEIVWLYPSTDSNECDSYVIWSPDENYWTYGSGIFTTFADKGTFDNTITTGASVAGNNLYNNEPENIFTVNGEAATSFLESADFDINDGNELMFIDRIVPDLAINDGVIKFSIKTKNFPEQADSELIEKGPFSISKNTNKVDLRARGRQGRVRVSCESAGTKWQWGTVRMSMQPDGLR